MTSSVSSSAFERWDFLPCAANSREGARIRMKWCTRCWLSRYCVRYITSSEPRCRRLTPYSCDRTVRRMSSGGSAYALRMLREDRCGATGSQRPRLNTARQTVRRCEEGHGKSAHTLRAVAQNAVHDPYRNLSTFPRVAATRRRRAAKPQFGHRHVQQIGVVHHSRPSTGTTVFSVFRNRAHRAYNASGRQCCWARRHTRRLQETAVPSALVARGTSHPRPSWSESWCRAACTLIESERAKPGLTMPALDHDFLVADINRRRAMWREILGLQLHIGVSIDVNRGDTNARAIADATCRLYSFHQTPIADNGVSFLSGSPT